MPHFNHHTLHDFFKDYEWIHLVLGILGNVLFFVGSVLFLYESLKTAGIWLFIIGAFFMMIGSIGNALVRLVERHEKQGE